MFIAYTDIGLFRSEDGGQSWTSATQGVPRRWTNTTYWITFDPAVKGRVWGVMSYAHDSPRPKMWRRTSPTRNAWWGAPQRGWRQDLARPRAQFVEPFVGEADCFFAD